jgi:hypothetical protein
MLVLSLQRHHPLLRTLRISKIRFVNYFSEDKQRKLGFSAKLFAKATGDMFRAIGGLVELRTLRIVFDASYPEIMEDLTREALRKLPKIERLEI